MSGEINEMNQACLADVINRLESVKAHLYPTSTLKNRVGTIQLEIKSCEDMLREIKESIADDDEYEDN